MDKKRKYIKKKSLELWHIVNTKQSLDIINGYHYGTFQSLYQVNVYCDASWDDVAISPTLVLCWDGQNIRHIPEVVFPWIMGASLAFG